MARRFFAALSTLRPWAMSFAPPWTIRTSAPRVHSSNRFAISSVRSPDTPQLRKRASSSRDPAQYSYWLFSSATPAPSESRVALSGSHRGAPAVIESPRAVTGVPP